jgi:hypothetical protein
MRSGKLPQMDTDRHRYAATDGTDFTGKNSFCFCEICAICGLSYLPGFSAVQSVFICVYLKLNSGVRE